MEFSCYNNDMQPVELASDWQRQRSFQFGDGHFTTAKIEANRVIWLDLHIQRLKTAHAQLQFQPINWHQLEVQIKDLASQHSSAILKIQISRGQATRGYQVSTQLTPYIFITVTPTPLESIKQLGQSVSINFLQQQLGLNPMFAGIKHCNRLEQIMLNCELSDKQWTDGLVTNLNGHVIESTKANIFWYDGANWHTPDLKMSGVKGVCRDKVMQLLPNVVISNVSKDEMLRRSQSMFLCNAIIGLVPVATLMDKPLNTQYVVDLKIQEQL